ncbi:hypothetical protein B0T24DRAFT_602154 [Lasiosphaeria ovina]|uniref:Stress-response A/B barrel domain-containing protein n=1 Tax=Lasiosphaeria ovina TaxID=92902 RepID=A0AAE0NJE5_9PEZI|nr:hypothetical protein B0T24DRAFT_602154 [Lasiosphaeria ovina]
MLVSSRARRPRTFSPSRGAKITPSKVSRHGFPISHINCPRPTDRPSQKRGVTHGFVVEFASPVDREYYVNTDPAHQAFKAIIGELVEELKTVVVDFSGGIFN